MPVKITIEGGGPAVEAVIAEALYAHNITAPVSREAVAIINARRLSTVRDVEGPFKIETVEAVAVKETAPPAPPASPEPPVRTTAAPPSKPNAPTITPPAAPASDA